MKSRASSLRLLFTSRPGKEFEDAVEALNIPVLDLHHSRGMDRDIQKFVGEVLDSDGRFESIPEEGKRLVRDALTAGANGM